jgi:hypothetical protein
LRSLIGDQTRLSNRYQALVVNVRPALLQSHLCGGCVRVKIQPDRFRTIREPNYEIDNDQEKGDRQPKAPSPEEGPHGTPRDRDEPASPEPSFGWSHRA